jgi:hypothetical protein
VDLKVTGSIADMIGVNLAVTVSKDVGQLQRPILVLKLK